MAYSFKPFTKEESNHLADFLLGSLWPFHGGTAPERDTILKRVEDGVYWSDSQQAHWMMDDAGRRVGLIHLRDLGDPTPLFDLRIAEEHRGRGLGREALQWLTSYLFENFPSVRRIEGYTRHDNIAMRRTFGKVGYVKEAYHRKGWSSSNGQWYDAVGYCMLREDWESGTVTPVNWQDGID